MARRTRSGSASGCQQPFPSSVPGQLRYEAVSTLTLQPGTYEIRVAARHEHANDTGSIHTYVDVPDFDKERGDVCLAPCCSIAARQR